MLCLSGLSYILVGCPVQSLPVGWTDDVVVSGDAVVLGGLVVSGGDVVVCGNVVVGGDVAKMKKKLGQLRIGEVNHQKWFRNGQVLFVIFTKKET